MSYRLGPEARAQCHRLHVHHTLGSTNTEAMERAHAGEVGPLWVAAKRQEAGRGRRGNVWASGVGNLTVSVLWPVRGVAPGHLAELGFVAGVALVAALDDVCVSAPGYDPKEPARSFRLKWPNDVLLGTQKLAGLLLETETLPGGQRAVVIGFGVNVAAAPGGLDAACLATVGYADGPEALLERLSDRLVAAIRAWDGGKDFAHVRERWLAQAAGLRSEIAVASGGQTLNGVFETIDEGGRLVILDPDGTRRTVTAGEVHFGTAATAA